MIWIVFCTIFSPQQLFEICLQKSFCLASSLLAALNCLLNALLTKKRGMCRLWGGIQLLDYPWVSSSILLLSQLLKRQWPWYMAEQQMICQSEALSLC